MEHTNMNPIILANLMTIRMNHDLTAYEQELYQQLLKTTQAYARLLEIRVRDEIKDVQDGQRTNQTPRGVSPSTPETQEHRGDDPSNTV